MKKRACTGEFENKLTAVVGGWTNPWYWPNPIAISVHHRWDYPE